MGEGPLTAPMYGEAIEVIPLHDPRTDGDIEAWAENIKATTGSQEAIALRLDLLENDLRNQMSWLSSLSNCWAV